MSAHTPGKIKRLYWNCRNIGAKPVLKALAFSRNWVGDFLWSIDDYRRVFGRYPNLHAPRRFSEHLLRLKLSRDGRSRLRAEISDKEFVKAYVKNKLGAGFTPKTLAVLRSKQEALAFQYPGTCVIKPTHMSGHVIFRRGGGPEFARSQIACWFERNFYDVAREPNYRHLQPAVIVEELLVEPGQDSVRDFKIFCFRGQPKFIQVDVNRFSGHRRNFYSPDWRELRFEMNYARHSEPVARPARLGEMLDAARRLAGDFTFIRVDFYLRDSAVLVGELTNFPEACCTRFEPDHADFLAGRLFREPSIDVEELFGAIVERPNPRRP